MLCVEKWRKKKIAMYLESRGGRGRVHGRWYVCFNKGVHENAGRRWRRIGHGRSFLLFLQVCVDGNEWVTYFYILCHSRRWYFRPNRHTLLARYSTKVYCGDHLSGVYPNTIVFWVSMVCTALDMVPSTEKIPYWWYYDIYIFRP